jgi:hypothetical protein
MIRAEEDEHKAFEWNIVLAFIMMNELELKDKHKVFEWNIVLA